MAKRCIGIDIGRSHVRAVQVSRRPEGFLIEKTFGMQTRRRTDSPADILRSLTSQHGFDRRAIVAVSLPHEAIFFVEMRTDEAGLQLLRQGDAALLGNDLPIGADEAIVQVCSARSTSQGQYAVLVAATSSELLREELRLLGEGKVRPIAVDTAVTAMYTAVGLNHPEAEEGIALIIGVDESGLCLVVTQDADILAVRSIPVVVPHDHSVELLAKQVTEVIDREVEITWRKLFGTEPDPDLRVFLVSSPEIAQHLIAAIREKIECEAVIVDPCATVRRADRTNMDSPLCVAEGLALRTLSAEPPDRIDFLAAHKHRDRPHGNLKKELTVCAGLLVMMAGVWLVGLLVQRSLLESEYARVKQRIDNAFRQALPEEKNIVNPLVQMQQRLDTFQEDYELFTSCGPSRQSPLEVLHTLCVHTPSEGNVRFNDLLVASDCVRAMGSCDKFAALSEWQRVLEGIPGFGTVDIPTQSRDPETGKVHFTLTITPERREQ